MTRLGCSMLAATAIVSGSSRARAEVPLSLEWHAPQSCPDVDYVLGAVRRIVGEDAKAASTITAIATIVSTKIGFHLDLVLTVGEVAPVTRSFDAVDCASLAESTAVVLSALVDDDRAPEPAPRAPELPPAPTGVRDAPVVARPPPTPVVPSVRAFAGSLIEFGSTPRASIAATIGAGLVREHVWAELSGAWAPSATAMTDAGRVSFSWWSASLRAGARHRWLAAGLGVDVTWVWATANELANAGDTRFSTLSPLAVVSLTAPLSPWLSLRFETSIARPMRRARFTFATEHEIAPAYTQTAFTARTGVSAEVSF